MEILIVVILSFSAGWYIGSYFENKNHVNFLRNQYEKLTGTILELDEIEKKKRTPKS